MTNLRWYTPLDGERVLQQETHFGWRDIEEVTEAGERADERDRREQAEVAALHARQRAELEAMSPAHRKAFKEFPVEGEFIWTGRRW